jgi:hypothetical protein
MEMILVGFEVGTIADKVAQVTGLFRDKFVRPRAKNLRDNGVWVGGKTALSAEVLADDAPETYMKTELILLFLCAEGLIENRPSGVEPT